MATSDEPTRNPHAPADPAPLAAGDRHRRSDSAHIRGAAVSTLAQLIQSREGWSAVWHDPTPQGNQARIVRLTTAQFEIYRSWPGVKIVRLQEK